MHTLSISYGNSGSCNSLTLQDASVYDSNIAVENQILEIKPPGKSCFYPFTLALGWCSKTFNCVDLDLCCVSPEVTALPDGIYEIKYSIDPNLQTMIEVEHFRVCNLYRKYLYAVCELRSKKCSYSHKEYRERVKELYEVKHLIADAVIMVEECLDKEVGMELYEEAKTLLNGNGCKSCK